MCICTLRWASGGLGAVPAHCLPPGLLHLLHSLCGEVACLVAPTCPPHCACLLSCLSRASPPPPPLPCPATVAHFPTAVKEFSWRNGFFYGLSQAAAAQGRPDPCPTHTAWLHEVGTI